MGMRVTSGRTRNQFARIYDRLRKRSLRWKNREAALWDAMDDIDEGPDFTYEAYEAANERWVEFVDSEAAMYGGPSMHDAYVKGVRDALNAVAEEIKGW